MKNRRISAVLHQRVEEEPVIALHGPRSVGKSTVLAEFAATRGVAVIDFDDLAVREAALLDPSLFAGGLAPLCIDEYQKVPAILDAVKARLNRERSEAGTAVLTGSTRQEAIAREAQSLTARLHTLMLLPLSQGEIDGTHENFLEHLLDEPEAAIAAHPSSSTTRPEYIKRITVGGFPMAASRNDAGRGRWFGDYVKLSIERDVLELRKIRQRDVLRHVLDRVAGQTAQVLNLKALIEAVGSNHDTVEGYVRLLEDLFLIHRLPGWGTTLHSRAKKLPKIHVVDSGIAAHLLHLTPAKLSGTNPSALTDFGHLAETFAVGELRKQASWLDETVNIGHWRTGDDAEVDLIVEAADGRIVAFEVKASERMPGTDLKGLRRLRDTLGDRFVAGVALTTGSRSFAYEDRIHVCPFDRLWRTV